MADAETILLAEDNADEVFLMQEALIKSGINCPVQVAETGLAVIDYLKGKGSYADRERFPLPFLIFLDLKMPVLDGFEVLRSIRKRHEFDSLIIVVLTSLHSLSDIQRAYDLGANSYLIKPSELPELVTMLTDLREYWITLNRWPSSVPQSDSNDQVSAQQESISRV